MKQNNAISSCRYYKGEKEYQGDYSDFLFWEAEQLYVQVEGTQKSADSVKFYLECGLAGANYDLPIELLAALFQVYCKGAESSPDLLATYFKDNFLTNYLARPL